MPKIELSRASESYSIGLEEEPDEQNLGLELGDGNTSQVESPMAIVEAGFLTQGRE